jgi:hypothetical protein
MSRQPAAWEGVPLVSAVIAEPSHNRPSDKRVWVLTPYRVPPHDPVVGIRLGGIGLDGLSLGGTSLRTDIRPILFLRREGR